jgi:serine/threonine protein kinase
MQACGALGERHAAMAVWEVLRLVRSCHAAGILHGDIKPSNFMLAPGNPLCPGACLFHRAHFSSQPTCTSA